MREIERERVRERERERVREIDRERKRESRAPNFDLITIRTRSRLYLHRRVHNRVELPSPATPCPLVRLPAIETPALLLYLGSVVLGGSDSRRRASTLKRSRYIYCETNPIHGAIKFCTCFVNSRLLTLHREEGGGGGERETRGFMQPFRKAWRLQTKCFTAFLGTWWDHLSISGEDFYYF